MTVRANHARSSIVDVSGSGRWCSHRAVPRNHGCCYWCPRHAVSRIHRCCHSLASASFFVTNQSCSIHCYKFSISCPNSHLVVRLYQFIITFPCNHFVYTFAPRKHVILDVVFTHPVGYSRPPSDVNDPSVTKYMNSRKSCPEDLFQILV